MAAIGGLITGGFGFIGDLIKVHKLNQWAKVIVATVFTYFVYFNLVCGGIWVTGKGGFLFGIGSGMITGTLRVIWMWNRNPLTKDIFRAVPRDALLQAEQEGDSESILLGKK